MSAILKNGNIGAKGGKRPNAGRPSSEIRDALRLSIAERIPVLCEIIDDPEADPRARVQAWSALARHAMPSQHETETKQADVLTDRQFVECYLALGVDQSKWKPGILARYKAGMIEGYPRSQDHA